MRIVLWIGNEPNQKALANKIHDRFPLAGIVTETRTKKSTLTVKKFAGKVVEKILANKIGKAWYGMLNHFQKLYPAYPAVPIMNAENINSDDVYQFTKEIAPHLIIVSGTRLIKEKLLSLQPESGIMNLHTGLSPYIKGGPNCTNWCLSTRQYHLIGNTIMWIDKGIDTGNIISTEFTNFTGHESLRDVHSCVMEHAHELYVKCISYINEGKKNNIPQKDIGPGITYYTKQWDLYQKLQLVLNFSDFKKQILSGEIEKKRKRIKTVHLV